MIHYDEERTGGYTVYSNRFVQDPELSLEAKAALRYLLSKPNTWQVCKNALKNALGVGRNVVDRITKELVTSGYLARCGASYVVFEDKSLAVGNANLAPGIVRFKRGSRPTGFSITSSAPFEDADIPLKARGLLCYLLSMPEDWRVELVHVAKALNVKLPVVERLLRELRQAKHVHRYQVKNDCGRIQSWGIDVYETCKQHPEYTAKKPRSTAMKNQAVLNQHVVKTKNTQRIERTKPLNPQEGEQGSVDESDVDSTRKRFGLLVAAYPAHRRGNVDDAFGEYQLALSSDEVIPTLEVLVDAVRLLSRGEQWLADGGKYIPKLKNWIHERQWADVTFTTPEVELAPDFTLAEDLQYTKELLYKRLKPWSVANPGKEVTQEIYLDTLVCLPVPSWTIAFLGAGHERVLRVSAKLTDEQIREDPEIAAFIDKEAPLLAETIRDYLAERATDVPSRP